MELKPGCKLDLRDVSLDQETWGEIRAAATAPDGKVRFGRCWFERSSIEGVSFHGVVFEGDVSFDRAEFGKGTSFYGTIFSGNAGFHDAVFCGNVSFHEAVFHGHADFCGARFSGDAVFNRAVWHRDAAFTGGWFNGAADFDRVVFRRDALIQEARFRSVVSWRHAEVFRHLLLDGTRFHDSAWIGPLATGGRVGLDGAYAVRSVKVAAGDTAVMARDAVLTKAHLKTPADLSRSAVEELLLEGVSPDECVLDDARVGLLTVRGIVPDTAGSARRRLIRTYAVSTLAFAAAVLLAFLSLHYGGSEPRQLAHHQFGHHSP